jgi:RNA polymerase sigma-70 factor (ECF subfamily)
MLDRDISDEELMRRVVGGDGQAFGELARRHAPAVRRLARSIVGDASADDVLQETLTLAFRRSETFRGPSVRAWLAAISRNAALRWRRAQSRLEPTDPTWFELGREAGWGSPGLRDMGAKAESEYAVTEALGRLDVEAREVLVLRDVLGFSGEEASEVLKISLPALKSRLHRARLQLIKVLRGSP